MRLREDAVDAPLYHMYMSACGVTRSMNQAQLGRFSLLSFDVQHRQCKEFFGCLCLLNYLGPHQNRALI